MQDLILRTRRMIFDTANLEGTFPEDDMLCARSNQEIQDCLDANRIDAWYELLLPAATRPALPAGIQFKDFYHQEGNWEADATLTDASYNILTPLTSDYIVGHWSFADSINYAVRIKGKYYDLYGAAADLLENWAAELKLQFAFSLGRDQFKLTDQFESLLTLADRYRLRQRPTFVHLERSDMASDQEAGFLDYPINGLYEGR